MLWKTSAHYVLTKWRGFLTLHNVACVITTRLYEVRFIQCSLILSVCHSVCLIHCSRLLNSAQVIRMAGIVDVPHCISEQKQTLETQYSQTLGLVLFPLLLWSCQPITLWQGFVLIHAVAHLNLAQLLERRGHHEQAVSLYRRCSRLNGAGLKDPRTHEATKISALLHLGRLYADQGRLHKAVAMYQEAVDKMPGHYPPQVSIQLDIRSRVQKFPAWHTKAAPNGKCCEGYIVPSMVRLMCHLKSVLK